MNHDKHQYFYEKYLRNEMPDMERQAFEEKLSSDESFRRSFNHYRSHRKQYLESLLEEDDTETTRRWGLSSWLYLTISLTGIILAVNYYIFTDSPVRAGEPKASTGSSWNFFKRIPFLSKKQATVKISDTVYVMRPAIEDSALLMERPEPEDRYLTDHFHTGLASDIMEVDSFMMAYEKNYFDLRVKAIKDETDSIMVDSLMFTLAAKSAGRNPQLSKPVTIYVEFWRSPVNFKGYKFNGKKLLIYGISSPYEIYLLHDNGEFILRTSKTECMLTDDNNFYKF